MPSIRPRETMLILIVEDTLEFAKLTQLTLKRIGLNSYHVSDGDAAVAYLQQQKPDLVVLDLNLPGMSGWQVLELMQDMYQGHQIPVIITSAYSDGANRVIGKLQEVFKYMIKPFAPQELMANVEEALGLASPT